MSSIQHRTITLPASRRALSFELERKAVKNLNLRIRADGTVHLSVPQSTTIAAAEAFLRDREAWILSALARMEQRRDTAARPHREGNSLPYLGGALEVTWQAGSPPRVEADLENRRLRVTLPNPQDTAMRQAALDTFESSETTKLVNGLVQAYFPLFAPRGVSYPKAIRVKVMKTRFGSCSPKGYLNFSSRLCEYPLPFVEYVVVHELCHFLEANHSDRFWREVERILPDWQERERLGKR